MSSPFYRVRNDQGRFAWSFALILLAVLTPSVGILWMTRAALENERLAIHQRLAETYYSHLNLIKARYEEEWSDRLEKLDSMVVSERPFESFRRCIELGVVDSVVVLDRNGNPVFPCETTRTSRDSLAGDVQWDAATALEFKSKELSEAIDAYRRFGEKSTDESVIGRAEQATARCLLKMDLRSEAVDELRRLMNRTDAFGPDGRSLALDAGVLLLDLFEKSSAESEAVSGWLKKLLADSKSEVYAASQRRFVIHRLIEQNADEPIQATWNAELLVAETLAEPLAPNDKRKPTFDFANDVWSIPTQSNQCIAIVRRASLEIELARFVKVLCLPENTEFGFRSTS